MTYDASIYMIMRLIYEEKVYQTHSTMRLALRIKPESLFSTSSPLFSPFCLSMLLTQYVVVLSGGRAVRTIVGEHLTCWGTKQAPLRKRHSHGGPKHEGSVWGPGMEKGNAELTEEFVQGAEVGKRWPGGLERREAGPGCLRWGDKVPDEVGRHFFFLQKRPEKDMRPKPSAFCKGLLHPCWRELNGKAPNVWIGHGNQSHVHFER